MESSYIKIEWKEKLCRTKESIDLEHMKQCKWMVQVKEGWQLNVPNTGHMQRNCKSRKQGAFSENYE